MARRGLGGGMTALRAALGAVSGGLEGARIQEAAAAEKKRMADAATRQAMMDEIALADKNFVEKGVREGLVRQATPAIGNAIRTAQAAMSGNITDAQPVDFSSLGKAAGMYGDTPAASVTLGGKTFQRMQNPIQASLMAAEQAATQARGLRQEVAKENAAKAAADAQAKKVERENQIQMYKKDFGFSTKDATMFVDNPNAFTTMRGQDFSAATARQALAAARERAGGQPAAAPERFAGDYTQTLAKIADFLPTTDPKTGTLIAPKRPLSAEKSFLVQEGSPERGFLGRATLMGASALGVDTSEEQLYNTLAKEVATAYAMREQQGRNVSNADLLNRQAQITVQPNERGNLEIQKVKGDRLRQWALTLQSGANIPQVKAGETAVAPVLPRSQMSIDEWMDANPQRAGEDDKAYLARGKASTGVQ